MCEESESEEKGMSGDKYEGMTRADRAYFKAKDEGKSLSQCVHAASMATLDEIEYEERSKERSEAEIMMDQADYFDCEGERNANNK